MKQTKIYYALLNKKTGHFLRVRETSNGSASFCGESSYSLTTERWDELPLFQADTLEEAISALVTDTPWYNSTPTKPTHDGLFERLSRCDVVIVKRTVVTETQDEELADLVLPPVLECYASIDLSNAQVEAYGLDPTSNPRAVLRLFEIPQGETIESLQRFEGKTVFSRQGNQFFLMKVFPAPADCLARLGWARDKVAFAALTYLANH